MYTRKSSVLGDAFDTVSSGSIFDYPMEWYPSVSEQQAIVLKVAVLAAVLPEVIPQTAYSLRQKCILMLRRLKPVFTFSCWLFHRLWVPRKSCVWDAITETASGPMFLLLSCKKHCRIDITPISLGVYQESNCSIHKGGYLKYHWHSNINSLWMCLAGGNKKIRYLSEVEIRMTLTTVSNKQSPEDPQKEKHNKLDNLKSRGLRRIFHFSELAGAREGHPQGLGCLPC